MANFDISFDKTMGVEGGYAHLAGDVGGRTMYGIAEKFHPHMWVNGPPTKAQAKEFYRTTFWDKLRLSDIRSQALANELFDSAVNLGLTRPVKWVQTVLNTLRREYTYRGIPWTPLKADGVLGPVSVAAINEYTGRGLTWEKALFAALEGCQIIKYLEESQPQFVRGHLAQRTEQWNDPSQ